MLNYEDVDVRDKIRLPRLRHGSPILKRAPAKSGKDREHEKTRILCRVSFNNPTLVWLAPKRGSEKYGI